VKLKQLLLRKDLLLIRIFNGRKPEKRIIIIRNFNYRHKMSSRRPRRSRIYDSNYNIGENYYKSAIDRLDEKYHSRPASSFLYRHSEPPAVSPTRPRIANIADDVLAEEDLEFSRERASRAIQRETILDQRSGRRGLELESSFDGQVSVLRGFCFETKIEG
jgi:hypothetical protein